MAQINPLHPKIIRPSSTLCRKEQNFQIAGHHEPKEFAACSACLFLCAACTTLSTLDDLLTKALPDGAEARISETCAPFMQGAVALLEKVSLPEEKLHEPRSGNGKWTRSLSLSGFAEADSAQYRGAGVAATLLDGKNCYRKISPEADKVLFGERSGWYDRSENREIVIAIFDLPAGEGVMFVQAP